MDEAADDVTAASAAAAQPQPLQPLPSAGSTAPETAAAATVAKLAPLLQRCLEAALEDAAAHNALEAPYGRAAVRMPYDEDDEDEDEGDEGGEDEEDDAATFASDDDAGTEPPPAFAFSYGYNPLAFMAQWLERENPVNIAKRHAERVAAVAFLQRRAAVAAARSANAQLLDSVDARRKSGIAYGPIASGLTNSSITLWAKAVKPCKLVFEVGVSPGLENILEIDTCDVDEKSDLAGAVELRMLQSGVTYYYRVSGMNPQYGMQGPAGGLFVEGQFTTLPESDETREVKFVVTATPLEAPPAADRAAHEAEAAGEDDMPVSLAPPQALADTCAAISKSSAAFSVCVGGLLARSAVRSCDLKTSAGCDALRGEYRKVIGNTAVTELLGSGAFLTAWQDDSRGSANALKSDERAAEKEERARAKKRGKAPPRDSAAPPLQPSLRVLKDWFPCPLDSSGEARKKAELEGGDTGGAAGGSRQMFGSVRCGSRAELFLLDTRGASLGRVQSEWVQGAVARSTAQWKIIVSQQPLAASAPNLQTVVPIAEMAELEKRGTGEGSEELDGAARLIQSQHRGRLARKETEILRLGGGGGGDEAAAAKKEKDAPAAGKEKEKKKDGKKKPGKDREAAEEKARTVYELATGFSAAGVKNVAYVTDNGAAPFAVRYRPRDLPGCPKGATFYELGASPLGGSDAADKPPRMDEHLSPKSLIDCGDLMGVPTFAVVRISEETGSLLFSVRDAEGKVLQETKLSPSGGY